MNFYFSGFWQASCLQMFVPQTRGCSQKPPTMLHVYLLSKHLFLHIPKAHTGRKVSTRFSASRNTSTQSDARHVLPARALLLKKHSLPVPGVLADFHPWFHSGVSRVKPFRHLECELRLRLTFGANANLRFVSQKVLGRDGAHGVFFVEGNSSHMRTEILWAHSLHYSRPTSSKTPPPPNT